MGETAVLKIQLKNGSQSSLPVLWQSTEHLDREGLEARELSE